MADIVSVEIKGLDELQKKLENLTDKDGTKYVRASARAGAEVIKQKLVEACPKDTGLTAEHMDIRTRKAGGEALAITATVGPNSKQVIHPQEKGKTKGLPRTAMQMVKFMEFGTSKIAKRPWMTGIAESIFGEAVDAVVTKLREKLKDLGAE